ncbi:hypothetical protein [Actinomadura madurae]|uniref:hypothetical protein n=1 Tax=Actinomadura madurae TaxID=1993 RepID=UPI0020D1F7AE|nr:hypothetical protein [Actinomadura madurae]MCP9955257.1 hypothetical protein [Actinomadura madurae]MCP9971993.1 hypothetical protein [Actinomadura madurae]MCP9984496.1 hypothetical protein [Actinomadura madurae]MCQ0020689.1 hypothetical protein [Actinomadura madurae]
MVIAADGLHSVARELVADDRPVSSAYVAYRGTVPTSSGRAAGVDLSEVVVYVGPRCHFVHYGLLGDAAHPSLQYIAQGAIMALEPSDEPPMFTPVPLSSARPGAMTATCR